MSYHIPCVEDLEDRETGDTTLHSWEVLAKILASEDTMEIVCDIGMYVTRPCKRRDVLTRNRQASRTQERDLQLQGDRSQQADPVHSSQDVACE